MGFQERHIAKNERGLDQTAESRLYQVATNEYVDLGGHWGGSRQADYSNQRDLTKWMHSLVEAWTTRNLYA